MRILNRIRVGWTIILGAALCLLLTSCQTSTAPTAKTDTAGPVKPLPATQEGIVKVQHILIGFGRTIPRKDLKRTKEEAEQLAKELVAKAQGGADFGELVKEHTDDSAPGIYIMADAGVDTMMLPTTDVMSRSNMVKGFGDVSFALKVGEVGLAEYNPLHSPFGWHVIKRLE